MPNPANGTAVNFGFATTSGGITITGITGVLLQNADYSAEADKDEVRDGNGNIVSRNWYDPHLKATLEWVITGTGIAAAITNTAIAALAPGTILVISACASVPDLVATNWEVVASPSIKASNTTSKRVSVPVEKRAGITGVQAA